MQRMKIKYFRTVLGITRRNRVRNTRERVEVEAVVEIMEGKHLRQFGHLVRISQDYLGSKDRWEEKT